MRKIKEVLRLKWELRLSNREIARSVGVSNSTVGDCLKRALRAGLSWGLVNDFTEEEVQQLLYAEHRNKTLPEDRKLDFAYIHEELKRKGVTLLLLWDEYSNSYPKGLSYSRYCALYREWSVTLDVTMRQTYKAGEKMFVDYAGMTVAINLVEGVQEAQIFVAALGASNYTFAEATLSQALPDWIGSHVKAFNFFGGVTEILIPDNLKSGVQKAHRYEPDLNPTYQDMAEHYGIAVIPARVRAPQDKAKVEEAVQNVERSILAKLRNRTFFSLREVNEAIKPLLKELNAKEFQKLPGSRISQFETLEKPVLKPLPLTPYAFAEWKKAKTGNDYHLELDGHYYSVPYKLIKKDLQIRYTQNTVEIFYKTKRVVSHQRSYQQGANTTITEHMPKSHQAYAEWTPPKIISWAQNNGEFTGDLVEKIIAVRIHPQQGFRSCLGLIRLGKSYGNDRLELACKRAMQVGAYSYKSVASILQKNLDKLILEPELQNQVTEQQHEYVRGNNYYQ
jgi:Transposase and inactivated derivatives